MSTTKGNSRPATAAAFIAIAIVGLLLGASVSAATNRSSSGQQWSTFWYCSYWCQPIGYWGEGTITATYTPSGSTTRINRIEQTMSLYYANNNPCDIGVGITTQVFADRGATLVANVPVYNRGSYWLSPSTLFYGGYSDINLSVRNPRLRGNGFASIGAGSTCLGWKSFNWNVDLY